MHPVSATHGRGIHSLIQALPVASEADATKEASNAIKIAFVGRPNVGKSTLINRILGESGLLFIIYPVRPVIALRFHLPAMRNPMF